MKRSLLAECGEGLYGPRWQSDLARDLGVSIRTMQRWAAGAIDLPDGVLADLRRLTERRATALSELTRRLHGA